MEDYQMKWPQSLMERTENMFPWSPKRNDCINAYYDEIDAIIVSIKQLGIADPAARKTIGRKLTERFAQDVSHYSSTMFDFWSGVLAALHRVGPDAEETRTEVRKLRDHWDKQLDKANRLLNDDLPNSFETFAEQAMSTSPPVFPPKSLHLTLIKGGKS